jgi:DNA helicase-2/ATP-dependent DNA helicase PcrA
MGMLGRHPGGTVAVISTKPREVERTLRLARFTTDPHDPSRLIGLSGAIRVLDPEDARVLEFVVVVEPGAFPTRFGRHGLL